jgi:hypothetical protein
VPVPVMMPAMMTVAMMPAIVTIVAMMPPMRFGCLGFDVLLHRRSSARIVERQRLRALGRSDQNKHRPNGCQSNNSGRGYPGHHFHPAHVSSPWIARPPASAARFAETETGDVNAV